ncbi:MAG: hypothetical protein INQ03_11280 [Candidatus Heimdallarchaeota archaeon]|nr:hypothetical protein [Candidatus Heimdallarchaeota archaeon]
MSEEKFRFISLISWIILIGYILFSLGTILTLYLFDWAVDLFDATEGIVKINAVWFSLFIAIYGSFALRKNFKRARLSNLNITLDSQFLLVAGFILFTLKEILYMIIHFANLDTIINYALENGAIVLNFGGYVALLASIYFGRKKGKSAA